MDLASLVATASACLAAYAALFHALLYRLRPGESEHLWLALVAAGVAAVSGATLGLYGAPDVATAVLWQRAMLASSVPVLLGFLRFSSLFLGVPARLLSRSAQIFGGGVLVACLGPDWVFDGQPFLRQPPLGPAFVQSGLSPLGVVAVVGFLGFFAAVLLLHARHLDIRQEAHRTVFFMLCLWFLTGLNDGALVARLYDGPNLVTGGYLAIVVGVSFLLVRRFARTVTSLELSAETLNEAVEARTAEVRQRELELAHGEQLATIGTLAASVAHEINNPIAFVHSNLNRLEELWEKPEAAGEVSEILAECRDGTERVRVIVTQLLHLARRSDGETAPVDLGEVVRSVLPVVRPVARCRANIDTVLSEVPFVMGDGRLLGQVVLNLVMNALEALPEGHPEENQVRVSTAYEDGSVWLMVRDTGPGIAPELRERLFDAFVTDKDGGTGLGLAVTDQIVARHGGRIEVQSDATGTCMILEFPADRLHGAGLEEVLP